MKIGEIHGSLAKCELNGVTRMVDLFLVTDQEPKPGDFVLVHVGYAIQLIDAHESQKRQELYREMVSGNA